MEIGQNWRNLIKVDPPQDAPVTAETRELTCKEADRYRGSVRISTGRFWTDEEYENYRKKILNTPLP